MNAIRRRRVSSASLFTPPQLANLRLWLAADSGVFSDTALTTPQSTDGGGVGGWKDKGPFANNATQGTGARQPLLKTSGLNGHPTVLFATASSQWMSADAIATSVTGSNLPCTVIAVCKPVSTATQVFFAFADGILPSQNWFFYISGTPVWACSKHDDTTHSTVVSGGTPDTNAHIVSWVGPGTTLTINVDGAVVLNAGGQTQAPTTLNTATIGAINSNAVQSSFLNSHIAEIFVWSAALSAGEQAGVRAAMAKKYAISSS